MPPYVYVILYLMNCTANELKDQRIAVFFRPGGSHASKSQHVCHWCWTDHTALPPPSNTICYKPAMREIPSADKTF